MICQTLLDPGSCCKLACLQIAASILLPRGQIHVLLLEDAALMVFVVTDDEDNIFICDTFISFAVTVQDCESLMLVVSAT